MAVFSSRFLFSILGLFITVSMLSSCGVRKKDRGARISHNIPDRASIIPTDASDARNKSFSGSRLASYAALLGVAERDLHNTSLYYFIDNWLGSPHRLGGLEKTGIDCSAFVGILYKEVYGKSLPRSSRDMGENVKRSYEKDLQEGDLIFFSFGGQTIDHVGVYLRNSKFVHVSTRKGVIISNMKDSWYYKYFVRCGKPKI